MSFGRSINMLLLRLRQKEHPDVTTIDEMIVLDDPTHPSSTPEPTTSLLNKHRHLNQPGWDETRNLNHKQNLRQQEKKPHLHHLHLKRPKPGRDQHHLLLACPVHNRRDSLRDQVPHHLEVRNRQDSPRDQVPHHLVILNHGPKSPDPASDWQLPTPLKAIEGSLFDLAKVRISFHHYQKALRDRVQTNTKMPLWTTI